MNRRSSTRRRFRPLRWLLVLFVLLVVLLIVAIIAAHFVLKSDLPRTVLLDALRDQTGLKVQAGDLDISWSGRTVISDLEIGLPLEDQPFVTVRRVRVKHNSLVWLALTRSLGLSDVRLVDPVVSLEAERGEQWNLIEAAEIVSLTRARRSDPNKGPSALPDLPRLRIERAAVEVNLPDGRELSYDPITIEGDPEGSLAWRFAVTLEDRIALRGQLAPGAGWDHRVSFNLDEVRSLVEPFIASLPEPLDAAGHWRGNIRSGTLAGSLTLDSVHVGRFSATGGMSAEVVGTQLRATPKDLVVSRSTQNEANATRTAVPDQLHITGGTLTADLERLAATDLVGRVDGYADFDLSGAWSLADSAGNAELSWRGMATRLTDEPIEHRGDLRAELAISPLGRLALVADLSTSGRASQGDWDLRGEITASGDSIEALTVTVDLPTGKLITPQLAADLDGLTFEALMDWPQITDARLLIPDARPDRAPLVLTAEGNASTLDWTAFANAESYTPPISSGALPELPPLSITLRARGDRDTAVLESLSAAAENTTLSAQGAVELADLSTTLSLAVEQKSLAVGDSFSAPAASVSADIDGVLSPLRLEADGTITVAEPAYKGRALGTVTTAYSASAAPESFGLFVEPFELLGGGVRLRSSYTTGDAEAKIAFSADGLSLAQAGELFGLPTSLSGTTSAELTAAIPLNDPTRTVASGTWTASGLNIADLALIEGEGTLTAGNGALRLPELTLRHAGGVLRGRADMDLDQPDRLHAVFTLDDWPLELEGPSLAVAADGDADLFIDLAPLGATGTINLLADLRYRDQPAATLTLDSSIEGRDLSVDSIELQTLGGEARGSGLIPLSAEFWERAAFELNWSDIDLADARRLVPALEPLSGMSSGSMAVGPAQDPRAELPLQLVIRSDFDNARFADFTLGGPDPNATDLSTTIHFGPQRAEIREGILLAAGGKLDLYGRASDHGGEIALFATLDMNNLDLQQIASAASFEDRPMPGRVSGEWTLGGTLNPPYRLFGSATMKLTDSDLLALPGISQIYSALNLDIGTPKPQGEGTVLLRLEGKTLKITRLIYFNRGTDVVAGLTIKDIFQGAQSPIEGVAVGSVRPLRAGAQSFFSSIDRLLRAAQANAVAVEIGGTIAKNKTRIAPLKDLTGSIERLLRGSAD